jgi:hypothetical protein
MESRLKPFRYERELAKPVAQWLLDQNLSVRTEFSTPWGICDIVGAELDPDNIKRRLALKQHHCIGPLLRVTLLLSIPDAETTDEVSFNTLQADYNGILSNGVLSTELEILCVNRFIRKTTNGGYQKLNGWMPLHRRIVAIEMKLDRVYDALHQAINNREFAPESFVAFPRQVAERVLASDRVHNFERVGVGIISVTHTECKILLPSQTYRREAQSAAETHCVERFWRTRTRSKAIQH